MILGRRGELDVARRVERGLDRVLNDADDEADADDLHRDVGPEMPNSEHAIGMSSSEPPATPEAPHAPRADMIESKIAAGSETCIPSVLAAAKVRRW